MDQRWTRGGPRGGPKGERVLRKLGAARNGLRNVHWDKLSNTEGTIWGDNVVSSIPVDELFEDIGEEFKRLQKRRKIRE